MKTTKVNLCGVDKVKRFVNVTGSCEYDVDLVSDRYIVDAKSIMGIFSLDLSKPIEVRAHCADSVQQEQFDARMKEFEA